MKRMQWEGRSFSILHLLVPAPASRRMVVTRLMESSSNTLGCPATLVPKRVPPCPSHFHFGSCFSSPLTLPFHQLPGPNLLPQLISHPLPHPACHRSPQSQHPSPPGRHLGCPRRLQTTQLADPSSDARGGALKTPSQPHTSSCAPPAAPHTSIPASASSVSSSIASLISTNASLIAPIAASNPLAASRVAAATSAANGASNPSAP